ncbi:hypothetical protein BVRB_4g092410 [Beta vulgaris subsp. vulgaris]|nr:hypothetical protein BVRB_4g092410 [Beta vulgaris subsp. vulgaris]
MTLSTTRSTMMMISKMKSDCGMRLREAGVLRDCLEELNDAVSELQESIKEMGHMKGNKKLKLKINDVQTWVSASMTDENTCMDGFRGKVMDGKLKDIVRGKIVSIVHLTSNPLALIHCFASSMVNLSD